MQPAPGVAGEACPIVGIGASAGGLRAFEAFFSGMRDGLEPRLAFVLVQHLSPAHDSILADLIRRCTTMKVFEAEDGMVARPGCVYVIPPDRAMTLQGHTLRLTAPILPQGHRLLIDEFFRSLAENLHEQAIGIVLSGTGSDGTLGVRAIKGEGGMVMAQDRASSEFEGMPGSALATGLVDFELAPAAMPGQLLAYLAHPSLAPRSGGFDLEPGSGNALRELFSRLRTGTGHDFASYKPCAIHLRIQRRMAVLGIGTLAEYVAYLEGTPAELEVLFRTLLIGVTQFFRDPEAFKALEEQVLPRLLEAGSARTGLRIWSPGCSTGEEAYSLAILLRERLEATGLKPGIQIFATDLDRQALVIARAGRYPASIAHDLSSGRLARFFTAEADGTTYQVHKDIRDLLVLSEQDLIKNPPLAHLDLIVCRNLLIYLGKDLHRRVLPLFHRALNPGGFLFLGTTENLGACGDLFTVLDGKAKLFQRKESKGPEPTLCPDRRSVAKGGRAAGGPNYLGTGARTSLRELTEQALLRQLAPAGALVDARGEILYLHGSTGTYLELPPGEPDHPNILKMARSGLRRGLAAALRKAVASGETVRSPGFRLPALHGHLEVDLTVGPVVAAPGTAGPLYLVVLEEAPCPVPDGAEPAPGARTGTEATQVELRGEAQSEQDELQEAAEVLASSNEELQAVNDDLQSTNAVLQTGKDELQSANEELATGNGELQATVADLVQANQDLNNLLAGTGLAAVFVDPAMKVLRFTPTATRIINLIPADCGRPMGHIASNLVGYDRLVQDVQEVLDTLSPKVQEVRTLDGKVYTMSIQPYRSLDDAPEGAVLTFVHPSGTKRSEAKANVP